MTGRDYIRGTDKECGLYADSTIHLIWTMGALYLYDVKVLDLPVDLDEYNYYIIFVLFWLLLRKLQ